MILGLWLEDAALAAKRAFGDALAAGMDRFVGFLGAGKLDVAAVPQPALSPALPSCGCPAPEKRARRCPGDEALIRAAVLARSNWAGPRPGSGILDGRRARLPSPEHSDQRARGRDHR